MKNFDFEDAMLFVALAVAVFAVGFLMSIPILVAVDKNNPSYLWMYSAYAVAIYIAYLIKRSV